MARANIILDENAMQTRPALTAFPKVRPLLPEQYARIYQSEYKANRSGVGLMSWLSQKAESWMHRAVLNSGKRYAGRSSRSLELGAGTLNHLRYETPDPLDVVEPAHFLLQESPLRSNVNAFYDDIGEIDPGMRYDRIYSIAGLEHIADLPALVARSALLLADGGIFQAAIPSEGKFLWWLGWRATTGLSYFLRNRLDYGVVMRHEHVNDCDEIVAVISEFFLSVTTKRYPTPLAHCSLYQYVEARRPNVVRAREYLSAMASAAVVGPVSAGCGEPTGSAPPSGNTLRQAR